MIIFNNLCPVVRPNLLHPGTLVPSEVPALPPSLVGNHGHLAYSPSSYFILEHLRDFP